MKRKFLKTVLLSGILVSTFGLVASCGSTSEDTTIDDDNKDDNTGDDNPIDTDDKQTNVTWEGLDQIFVYKGEEEPDVLKGVSAKGENGETLTVKIAETSLKLDMTRVGRQNITLQAFNGDVAIDEDHNGIAIRTVIVQNSISLDNSTFDDGTEAWSTWSGSGEDKVKGSVSISWDNEEKALKAQVKEAGSEFWVNQVQYVGLNNVGLSTQAQKSYEISFRCKSDTERNVGITVEMKKGGYVDEDSDNGYGVKTTKDWQTYTFVVTSTSECSDVKIAFCLGRYNEDDDAPSTMWFDDVTIKPLAKLANSTGVVFEDPNSEKDGLGIAKSYDIVYNYDEYKNLSPITAKDAEGNDITKDLKKIGATPSSFDGEYRLLFAELYTYTDSQDNLSYFVRKIDYRIMDAN